MLHVDGGDDVDAPLKDFEHILITFGVAAAVGVGVGQLVDQRYLRGPGDDGVDVHLLKDGVPHPPYKAGQAFETFGQRLRIRAVMLLQIADDHVHFLPLEAQAFLKHGVGFPHTRRVSQIDFQRALPFALNKLRESVHARIPPSSTASPGPSALRGAPVQGRFIPPLFIQGTCQNFSRAILRR